MGEGRGEGTRRAAASAFAVLTPPGRGGIAVLRCIGPGATGAVEACFRPPAPAAQSLTPHSAFRTPHSALPSCGRLAYGHVLDAAGRPLDEVIVYREAADRFEVNCHGGPAAVKAVAARLAELGLAQVTPDRLLELQGAGPIERAARRGLRDARTTRAARVLLDQLGGALEDAVRQADAALAAGRTDEAGRTLDGLLDRWQHLGRYLADPPRIVIAGRPSCGKSTLVNRLVGTERVITSAVPGTTRDFVEAEAALEGLPVVLVDTAGLRRSEDEVERQGVERAERELARADGVVYLLDAARGAAPEDRAAVAALGGRAIIVWNKADLAAGAEGCPAGPPSPRPSATPRSAASRRSTSPTRGEGDVAPSLGPSPTGGEGILAISALTGQGVEELGRRILDKLDYRPAEPGAAVPLAASQAEALEAARRALASGDAAEARPCLQALLPTKPA